MSESSMTQESDNQQGSSLVCSTGDPGALVSDLSVPVPSFHNYNLPTSITQGSLPYVLVPAVPKP